MSIFNSAGWLAGDLRSLLGKKKHHFGLLNFKSNGFVYRGTKKWFNVALGANFILYGADTRNAIEKQPRDENEQLLVFIPNMVDRSKNLWIVCDNQKQFE